MSQQKKSKPKYVPKYDLSAEDFIDNDDFRINAFDDSYYEDIESIKKSLVTNSSAYLYL